MSIPGILHARLTCVEEEAFVYLLLTCVRDRGTGERGKGRLQNKDPRLLISAEAGGRKIRLANSHWALKTINSRVKSAIRKSVRQFLIGERIAY